MRSLRVLMADALVSCQYRGHDMDRFDVSSSVSRVSDGVYVKRETAIATCKVCGAYVQCLTHPAPNQIDIGGSAVAIGCGDRA